MKYRKFTTTGEIHAKRKERKEFIGCSLILFVALILTIGLLYLSFPNNVLLGKTALCDITYRQLILLVMFFTSIFTITIGVLVSGKGAKLSYYLKTMAWGIFLGVILHGIGVSLLLNTNRWLADDKPAQSKYRVTEVRFQHPNKSARYRALLPECCILQAERIGSSSEHFYFHVPIDTQVAVGCTLSVIIRDGIFGWKVVEGLSIDCQELN